MKVQAGLCEQVLAHGAVLSFLDADLPINLACLLACVHVLKQGGEGDSTEYLEVAEIAVIHEFAVLQVDATGWHALSLHPSHQTTWNKNCICIHLGDPICRLILALYF